MKKISLILFFVLNVVFLIYLLLPSPPLPPPLPDSLKSTEPGDTVQISGVVAYFSQYDRAYVTAYYQDSFDKLPILGIKLPSYRLNHPPEFAREKIRDQIQTGFLEEVVHPFRESLFINGFQPEIDYKNNPQSLNKYRLIVDGKLYVSKTTLRPFYSSLQARITNYFLILTSFVIIYQLIKKIFKQ